MGESRHDRENKTLLRECNHEIRHKKCVITLFHALIQHFFPARSSDLFPKPETRFRFQLGMHRRQAHRSDPEKLDPRFAMRLELLKNMPNDEEAARDTLSTRSNERTMFLTFVRTASAGSAKRDQQDIF